MDQILLVSFVAVVGSLLLPAMRLARVIQQGRTRSTSPYHRVTSIGLESETDKTDMRLRVQGEPTAGREINGDIKKQIDQPLAPSAAAGELGFRPLTAEEKKAFVNSLDIKGRQILAELAGAAKS